VRTAQVVRVSLETTEAKGQLDDGTTYTYWTFNLSQRWGARFCAFEEWTLRYIKADRDMI